MPLLPPPRHPPPPTQPVESQYEVTKIVQTDRNLSSVWNLLNYDCCCSEFAFVQIV